MKKSKFKFLIVALFAIGLTLTSCGNKSNNSTQTEQSEKQGKEYTSAYVCPMHCEGSGSDEAGKCPVCGMDYVKMKTIKKTGINIKSIPNDVILNQYFESLWLR